MTTPTTTRAPSTGAPSTSTSTSAHAPVPRLSDAERAALVLAAVVLTGSLVEMVEFWRRIGRARRFARTGRRFERRLSTEGARVLVLGDSTGVGVGATLPEESIAGLLAADYPDADIVNLAVSGTRVAAAVTQAQACLDAGLHVDLALLHVGANDVVADTPLDALGADCDALLQLLAQVATRTVWLGPPDLGLAPLFPRAYAWRMAARSRAASVVFTAAAARHGVAFVDFSAPAHLAYLKERRRHSFAVDGFHPNDASYRYGYASARSLLGLPQTSD